jgi:SAM-dependent methyltransferase
MTPGRNVVPSAGSEYDAAMTEETRLPRRRLLPWRAIAFAALAVLLTGAAWFHWKARRELASSSYTPPPERVGLNAPFITSPSPVVDEMVRLAELTPDSVAYDLGCGDGRIIITAASQTGCRGVGFDIDPERVAEARENARLHGVEHLVEIRQQDIFTVDLSEADAVLFYLLPWMNKKLLLQLQQMKPGSRVISHDFALGDIKSIPPETTVEVPVEGRDESHRVYRWIVPFHVPEQLQSH